MTYRGKMPCSGRSPNFRYYPRQSVFNIQSALRLWKFPFVVIASGAADAEFSPSAPRNTATAAARSRLG
jgi:hypothetical protein